MDCWRLSTLEWSCLQVKQGQTLSASSSVSFKHAVWNHLAHMQHLILFSSFFPFLQSGTQSFVFICHNLVFYIEIYGCQS